MLRAAADVPPAFKKSRRFQNEFSLSKGFVLSRAAKSQFVKAYASCRWSSLAPLHPGSPMRTATKESAHSICATDKGYRIPLTAMSRALKRPEPIRFSRSPRDCAGHNNLARPVPSSSPLRRTSCFKALLPDGHSSCRAFDFKG